MQLTKRVKSTVYYKSQNKNLKYLISFIYLFIYLKFTRTEKASFFRQKVAFEMFETQTKRCCSAKAAVKKLDMYCIALLFDKKVFQKSIYDSKKFQLTVGNVYLSMLNEPIQK